MHQEFTDFFKAIISYNPKLKKSSGGSDKACMKKEAYSKILDNLLAIETTLMYGIKMNPATNPDQANEIQNNQQFILNEIRSLKKNFIAFYKELEKENEDLLKRLKALEAKS